MWYVFLQWGLNIWSLLSWKVPPCVACAGKNDLRIFFLVWILLYARNIYMHVSLILLKSKYLSYDKNETFLFHFRTRDFSLNIWVTLLCKKDTVVDVLTVTIIMIRSWLGLGFESPLVTDQRRVLRPWRGSLRCQGRMGPQQYFSVVIVLRPR